MAQRNFCSACGAPLQATDKFCSNCGVEIDHTENCRQRYGAPPTDPVRQNTTGAFLRMLAYIPGLFWVPLAADSRDQYNRECANQGLLLLLYCMILPILFSIVGMITACMGITSAVSASAYAKPVTPYPYVNPYPYAGSDSFHAFFNNFGTSFDRFGKLFQPVGGIVFSNVIAGLLIPLLFSLFSLYVPINSIWGFIHCINHCEPHTLPLIGKIKIIK